MQDHIAVEQDRSGGGVRVVEIQGPLVHHGRPRIGVGKGRHQRGGADAQGHVSARGQRAVECHCARLHAEAGAARAAAGGVLRKGEGVARDGLDEGACRQVGVGAGEKHPRDQARGTAHAHLVGAGADARANDRLCAGAQAGDDRVVGRPRAGDPHSQREARPVGDRQSRGPGNPVGLHASDAHAARGQGAVRIGISGVGEHRAEGEGRGRSGAHAGDGLGKRDGSAHHTADDGSHGNPVPVHGHTRVHAGTRIERERGSAWDERHPGIGHPHRHRGEGQVVAHGGRRWRGE